MDATFRARALERKLRSLATEDRSARARYECELVELYRSAPAARNAVVEVFVPFAMSFAHKLKRGEEPIEDLRQVAMVALMKALDRFDTSRGSSFVAYAAPTILGELRRHYRDTGWAVHVPRSKQELAQRIGKAEREITRADGVATAAAVAERLELSVEDIVEGRIAANAMRTGSLDQPRRQGEPDSTVADTHGKIDTGYEAVEDRLAAAKLTRDLPERDQLMLRLRFHDELSQQEIGDRIGVSQMQVSRLLRRTIDELQTAATA